MADVEPFEPQGGASLAVTTASARVAFGGGGPQVLVTNYGASTAFVAIGDSTVVATIANQAVLPSTQLLLSRGSDRPGTGTHIAAITASGATTLQVSDGSGI